MAQPPHRASGVDSSSTRPDSLSPAQMPRKRKRSDIEGTKTSEVIVKEESSRAATLPQSDFGSSHSAEDPLVSLVLASMNGTNNRQRGKQQNGDRTDDTLASNATDDDVDNKLRHKKRKLGSEESDEEEIEDEDVSSDEDRAEYLEDDEDDDFYPSTRAAAAARSGNSSTSPPATSSPPSSPSSYPSRRENSESNLSLVETRKRRHRTTPEQLRILEGAYRHERMPSLELREKLAQQLGMTPRRVQIWFQNKRAKDKRARISVRLQQNGKPSSRHHSSRHTDGSNFNDYSGTNTTLQHGAVPMRAGASFVVPVRTADGKIALAAFPAAMMNASGTNQHMYPGQNPVMAGAQFAAPMTMAAIPGASTAPNGMSTPAMYMSSMMSPQVARYGVPGMPMYGWPGADPSMMWQAQMLAAQQQHMQLAASQMSQSQSSGQPKPAGFQHPFMMTGAPPPVSPSLGSPSAPGGSAAPSPQPGASSALVKTEPAADNSSTTQFSASLSTQASQSSGASPAPPETSGSGDSQPAPGAP